MIDYAKYANMSRKQLVNSLDSVEKRTIKYRAEAQAKIKDMQDLAFFLQEKIKESFAKPKYEFKTLDGWGLNKLTREVEKQFTPQELDEIRQEVKAEMMEQSDEGIPLPLRLNA